MAQLLLEARVMGPAKYAAMPIGLRGNSAFVLRAEGARDEIVRTDGQKAF